MPCLLFYRSTPTARSTGFRGINDGPRAVRIYPTVQLSSPLRREV